MSETEAKLTEASSDEGGKGSKLVFKCALKEGFYQAPTTAPPAVPTESAPVIAEACKEDIPAADADEKENGEQKQEEVATKKEERPVEAKPKDPREDLLGWMNSLVPNAVHKVNYQVLDWAQQLAVEDADKRQPLPGKNDATTKNQFLSFLRDGTLLAKLANRLQPGTVETVHEGDEAKSKENQTSNINAFINFAKEKAGLSEEQVFSVEDLQDKGKAGYQSVFNTIMQLAMKAQNVFEQKGIDVDQVVQTASQVVQTNLIQTILNFFRRARPAQSPKQLAKEAEEKEKAEKAAAEKVIEEKDDEEVCKKVEAVTAEPPPAVAAN